MQFYNRLVKLQYPKYELIDLKQDQGWDPSFDYVWYKKNSFLDSVKNQAHYIKELYFAGGEPLLIPEHYAILQFMIDEGYAKDCILRYNSNATDISQRLLDMWEYFKEVKFNFRFCTTWSHRYFTAVFCEEL